MCAEAEPQIVAQHVEPAGARGNGHRRSVATQDRLNQSPVSQVDPQQRIGLALAQAGDTDAPAHQAADTALGTPAQRHLRADAAGNRLGQRRTSVGENDLQRHVGRLRRR